MVPGDRLVCLLVEDYSLGDKFNDWPLHVTIVPWFRSKIDDRKLAKSLEDALTVIHPFKYTVGEEKLFGRSKNKLVNVIKDNRALISLEKIVRSIISSRADWMIDRTTKVRQRFRPHVTVQRGERLVNGDSISVNKVYLVEQKGSFKEIVAIASLKK